MSSTALLVIDVQNSLFTEPGFPVYQEEILLHNIETLIQKAHEAQVPVFFVQHTEGEGSSLEDGSEGWQIHKRLIVNENDLRFTKTRPDAFYKTPLYSLLSQHNITDLVLCGLQSEYCVDTTCRAASSLGYRSILVSDAHSTYDNDLLKASVIIAHHNGVLQSFAKLRLTSEVQF